MIGGFNFSGPLCLGCGEPLLVENAWMNDGCPCNSPEGVNSQNERRWRFLWDLQQQQSMQLSKSIEFLRKAGGEGRIVSSNDLTELQIAQARACNRFFVDAETGYGWAILPWDLRTSKDVQREALYASESKAMEKNS